MTGQDLTHCVTWVRVDSVNTRHHRAPETWANMGLGFARRGVRRRRGALKPGAASRAAGVIDTAVNKAHSPP